MKEDEELVGKDFWGGALLGLVLSMMIVVGVWFLFTYFTIWF